MLNDPRGWGTKVLVKRCGAGRGRAAETAERQSVKQKRVLVPAEDVVSGRCASEAEYMKLLAQHFSERRSELASLCKLSCKARR